MMLLAFTLPKARVPTPQPQAIKMGRIPHRSGWPLGIEEEGCRDGSPLLRVYHLPM